ncbi:toll/interleukin-1 receptor domain-containing protein [Elizabethkingia ursingii]|uniref:TIR domain-containing protein n=1 Tax=Elizabethkingia ursingii TaxID=1756150 RepID=A0ABX3N7T1_9FLAO|nr:toll/interleukin-1 receptor domain-containing protein [Elizabethkingia ursingii]OPB88516.1 hypothetical protein BB021_08190 [Elizabethkingia ursingii]
MINKGLNKAEFGERLEWIIASNLNRLTNRPCVFLSHKKEDKPECRKIADYFREAGIDYYLDEEDSILQQASLAGDAVKITESIKKGIRESTHMMVVVSEKTAQSQWVPFEIGYGHASIFDQDKSILEDTKIKLSVLTLKDIAEKELPDYLKVGFLIKGTKTLNEYISKIVGESESYMQLKRKVFSNNSPNHPLDNVLNWKL